MKAGRHFSGINLEYLSFNKKLLECYSTLQWVFFSISVHFLLFLSDDNLKRARNRTSKTISKYLNSESNNSNNLLACLLIGIPQNSLGREKKND